MQAENDLFNEDEQGNGSFDWREEEDQATVYKNVRIKDLFPVNYHEQRQIFMQKHENYNPHFCYKVIVSPEVITLHTEHEQLAFKILVNNTFEPPQLPNLSQEEVLSITKEYLTNLGLNDYVEIEMEADRLSRTSVAFFKEKIVLRLRMPLEYNKINLEGVLHHQIGTHVIRTLNHRDNCVRKPSEKGKIIEEGLAAINQLLPEERPFLFKAALRYVSAIFASKMNFVDLYKHVQKYVKDPLECWRECVRVKRGIANTGEEHGGYYKDQTYLIGAIEILANRKSIDFKKIFYGKLSPEETKNLQNGVLPPFIDNEEKFKHYLKKLDAIAICNFVD